MSVLTEASGAQVLPRKDGEQRLTVSPYQAEQVCSADLRATSAAHRELAEHLQVRSES